VYETPRTSPDGTHIAVHASDGDNDIWIFDVKSETLTRLTFDKGTDSSPLWTRDGTRVVYTSGRDGPPNLFWKAANGTGQAEPLMTSPPASSGALVANSFTPDGKSLVYSVGVPADIMLLPLEGERRPRPLMAQPQFAERGGDVSPDGRWIAYYSNESGTFEVYVRPFPDVDSGRWQVSSGGGTLPTWSRDGMELFYVDARAHLARVPVERGATFSFGRAMQLFDLSDSLAVYRNFDVTPDPQRFAVVKQQRSRATPNFVVVEHWFEELKARVPTK
jgi:Tol biopolymer transport system component